MDESTVEVKQLNVNSCIKTEDTEGKSLKSIYMFRAEEDVS